MLVPAILYKEQISKEFQRKFYTEDMFLETGSLYQWSPEILDNPADGQFDYAIIHNNKLIGYLSYRVDYYCSKVYNFGLMSFDKGNFVVGKDVFDKIEELVELYHRVEWRMICGNPVERSYDRFCKKHNGKKHILKDAIKDKYGNYRDDVIYEIVGGEQLKNVRNLGKRSAQEVVDKLKEYGIELPDSDDMIMTSKDIDDLINICCHCRMDKAYIPTIPEEGRAYVDGYEDCRDDIVGTLLQIREELEDIDPTNVPVEDYHDMKIAQLKTAMESDRHRIQEIVDILVEQVRELLESEE